MGRIKFVIALLVVLLIPLWAWADADVITQLGASQIGDNTAKAIHYDPQLFNRTIALFEGPENNILPSGSDSESVQRIRHRLAGHTYWAVHYLPKDGNENRDELAVFIDSHTGAILGIYTGE